MEKETPQWDMGWLVIGLLLFGFLGFIPLFIVGQNLPKYQYVWMFYAKWVGGGIGLFTIGFVIHHIVQHATRGELTVEFSNQPIFTPGQKMTGTVTYRVTRNQEVKELAVALRCSRYSHARGSRSNTQAGGRWAEIYRLEVSVAKDFAVTPQRLWQQHFEIDIPLEIDESQSEYGKLHEQANQALGMFGLGLSDEAPKIRSGENYPGLENLQTAQEHIRTGSTSTPKDEKWSLMVTARYASGSDLWIDEPIHIVRAS